MAYFALACKRVRSAGPLIGLPGNRRTATVFNLEDVDAAAIAVAGASTGGARLAGGDVAGFSFASCDFALLGAASSGDFAASCGSCSASPQPLPFSEYFAGGNSAFGSVFGSDFGV